MSGKKLFLFGECTNYKDKKVNLILSNARYAVWVRRNMAYFDKNKVDVIDVFKSIVRKNVFLMWKCLSKDEFGKAFVKESGFISTNEGSSIKF